MQRGAGPKHVSLLNLRDKIPLTPILKPSRPFLQFSKAALHLQEAITHCEKGGLLHSIQNSKPYSCCKYAAAASPQSWTLSQTRSR